MKISQIDITDDLGARYVIDTTKPLSVRQTPEDDVEIASGGCSRTFRDRSKMIFADLRVLDRLAGLGWNFCYDFSKPQPCGAGDRVRIGSIDLYGERIYWDRIKRVYIDDGWVHVLHGDDCRNAVSQRVCNFDMEKYEEVKRWFPHRKLDIVNGPFCTDHPMKGGWQGAFDKDVEEMLCDRYKELSTTQTACLQRELANAKACAAHWKEVAEDRLSELKMRETHEALKKERERVFGSEKKSMGELYLHYKKKSEVLERELKEARKRVNTHDCPTFQKLLAQQECEKLRKKNAGLITSMSDYYKSQLAQSRAETQEYARIFGALQGRYDELRKINEQLKNAINIRSGDTRKEIKSMLKKILRMI